MRRAACLRYRLLPAIRLLHRRVSSNTEMISHSLWNSTSLPRVDASAMCAHQAMDLTQKKAMPLIARRLLARLLLPVPRRHL
mmetsp:Transcript_17069/g.51640  ORF Transcript_17069/g.51640 Transcript_17069/m.51640 type:complete len:82 (-) Transcript_17069:1159-1404(-)